MEFFKRRTHINFMAQRKWAALISIVLFLFSIATLAVRGLHWGLDFTGGTQIQLSFPNEANLNDIRLKLETAGFPDAVVYSYGTSKEVMVTLVSKDISKTKETAVNNQARTEMVNKAVAALPGAKLEQDNYIGPQVGQEMVVKSVYAIFFALLATMVYIAFRFDLRFAIGSTVALIHDPVLILGVFSLLQVEFNLIALAAVLTVIGYSLNDTIVIFDRVRENFRKMRKADTVDIMNESINQTLSRTIMTSALTLMVVFALFFLGGNLLYGFSLALIIGIIVGTYSSIYVAGSLTLALGLSRQHLIPQQKEEDARP